MKEELRRELLREARYLATAYELKSVRLRKAAKVEPNPALAEIMITNADHADRTAQMERDLAEMLAKSTLDEFEEDR